MKWQTLLLVGLALSMTACSQKDEVDPENVEETPMAAEDQPDSQFLEHMHRHAAYLDALNMALAEGDFDAAMTPAYWLSRHEEVDGIPPDWRPWLEGVRQSARDVENSTDLESARAAAEPITMQCQACHTAAGVDRE
ncbi:MAG: hypothetical protein WBM45_14395 [Woeseiaceae bacterium]